MATTKMSKTKSTSTELTEIAEIKDASTTVTVDADALIKSILNNTNNNQTHTISKRYIMCRSVTNGGLNINCRSGNTYEFKDYGYDCEIEYDDLVALIRKHSDHIFMPRFVIEDEDFLNEFEQVAKAYEKVYTKEELNSLFDLSPNQMINEIKNMPANVQKNLQNLIATKIADGSIDSVKKIRALSDYFDSDFNLLSELFSK